jgi:hypothetical protein
VFREPAESAVFLHLRCRARPRPATRRAGAPHYRSFTYVILGSVGPRAARLHPVRSRLLGAPRERAGDRSDRAQTGPEGSEGVPASAETAVAHGTASEEATSGDVGTDSGGENPDAIDMSRSTSVPIGHLLPGGLEPEVLLPVQFDAYVQRRRAWTGEQRLMAAILEDAVDVCTSPTTLANAKRQRLQREAIVWLRSNDRARMFSFLRVCEALDLDSGTIRRGVYLRRAEAYPRNGPPGVTGEGVGRSVPTRPRRSG